MNSSCLGLILFKKAHSATELEHKASVYDINLSVSCLQSIMDPIIFLLLDSIHRQVQFNIA